MKCPEIEPLIEDYEYGELDAPLALEVEAHLAVCGNCSRLFESLRSENMLYENYGRTLGSALEIDPSMWEKVREKAAAGNSAVRDRSHAGNFLNSIFDLAHLLSDSAMARRMLFASLLVLLSVGSTLLVVRYYRGLAPPSVEINGHGQPGPSQPGSLQDALLSIKRAESEYAKAIQVLSSIVDKRKATMEPGLAAELEKNLNIIDEAIASARSAYHAHPRDPELAQYMLAAYQKKVELLQELAVLPM